ncbi:MAG: hypothetical protein CSA76_00365 [Spirochaetales bacterium]|nr:MAG: hypothetical protein CSA76_00365 [Spirochaetales bacterium]
MLMPALAAAALLLLLPRGFVAGGKTAYEMRMRVLPVPGLPEGSFSSYKSLSRLFNSRESSELPNFSSLVASRAYQESLLFGGRYELPQPGNGISLTSYREDGARMEAVSSSILQFDNSWYMDVTEDETVSGTGRLLASRGGPAPVFRQSRAVGGLPALSRLWELISGFFIIISLLLSTGIPAKFNTSERIPNSFISSFRFRRRIEAA